MTADQEGFQRTGIGISDGGMLSQGAELAQGRRADLQQAAHFAWSVHRGRIDPGLVEQLPELGFGQAQNLGVTLAPRNASKTAGEPPLRHARGHAATCVFPRPQSRLKTPSNVCERSGARPACDPAPAARREPLTPDPAQRRRYRTHPARSRTVGCGEA